LRFRSPSPDATLVAAAHLGEAIDAGGLVLALLGDLGAGKTLFVKGLAQGLGLDPASVTSPTFVIASEYRTPTGVRLAHVDLYRLTSDAELEATGFLDLLAPGAVVAVEWADRLPGVLPRDRLELTIRRDPACADARDFEAVAFGATAAGCLSRWCAALSREDARALALEAAAGT